MRQDERDHFEIDKKSYRPNLQLIVSALSFLEALEPRVAPAVLVNASTITFTDLDGDVVTVKFSRGVFDSPEAAALALEFDSDFSETGPQQLQAIRLEGDNRFQGVGITVSTQRGGPGDNLVNVGAILAAGIDLNKVSIQGDLGKIEAGSDGAVRPQALGSLDVRTVAEQGTSSQAPGGDTLSRIVGKVGKFLIKDNLYGSLVIEGEVQKGEVRGSVDAASLPDVNRPGILRIDAEVKKLDLGGIGGNTEGTGVVLLNGGAGKVTILGTIIGGDGNNSGLLQIAGGPVLSFGVRGDITGGEGEGSGAVVIEELVRKLKLGGAIAGGDGEGSGAVILENGGQSIAVKDVKGGAGDGSGILIIQGAVTKKLSVGNVEGGVGLASGFVLATEQVQGTVNVGTIQGNLGVGSGVVQFDQEISKIQTGKVSGGDGDGSGSLLLLDGVGQLGVGGIQGGDGTGSGVVRVEGDAGPVIINGGINAGMGDESGRLEITGNAASIVVIPNSPAISASDNPGVGAGALFVGGDVRTTLNLRGSIVGGDSAFSGSVNIDGSVRTLFTGDLQGGSGFKSGSVTVEGSVTNARLGSLNGGSGESSGGIQVDAMGRAITGSLTGGAGLASGAFFSTGTIGQIMVRGGTQGGGGALSGGIFSFEGSINNARINGSVETGSGASSAAVVAAETLNLQVTGNALGLGSVLYFAGGNTSGSNTQAIGRLLVGRDLFNAEVLGGWAMDLDSQNTPVPITGNGSIGRVQVGLFMVNSQIGAGVTPGIGGFGQNSMPIGGGSSSIEFFSVARQLLGFPDQGIASETIARIVLSGRAVPVEDGSNIANGGGTFLINLV
jgi:hypothetical protein